MTAGLPSSGHLHEEGPNVADDAPTSTGEPFLAWLDRRSATARQREREFDDPRLEYRRLFSEVWGTFLLVLVAAGGGVIGAEAYGGDLTLAMKALAPGVMVLGIIFFMGTISGAHLNPAVTLAFAVRGNFPWFSPRPRLHSRPTDRGGAGVPVPAGDVRKCDQRRYRTGAWGQALGGDAHRSRTDPGAGQRHPRHLRRGRATSASTKLPLSVIHRSGVCLAGPGHRSVDQPDPFPRPGAGRRKSDGLLD